VFDAFAREHLRFDRAFSEAPWTLPAMASLFTSLYPSQHGVVSHPREQFVAHGPLDRGLRHSDVLAASTTTLAEVLKGAGFRTAAFVSNPWLDSRFGLAQGFDHYDDRFARFGVPGRAVSRAALRWIAAQPPESRFFAYLHTIDSHRPYGALDWGETLARADALKSDPRRLTPEQREELAPLLRFEGEAEKRGHLVEVTAALVELAYDRGIENFDAALGTLLDGLAAHPAWERTAVIVTSDHGEALYERGYGSHGEALFDEELAIPLAARLPGASAREAPIDCPVGLLDLLPTLCVYFGIECPEPVFGVSWLPAPGRAPRSLLAEGVMERPQHRAIRSAGWKLSYEPGGGPGREELRQPWSLYDLRADPGETRNLLDGEPTAEVRRVAERLKSRLVAGVPAVERPDAPTVPIGADLEERLEELGYLE
jgi:arylsulfatase A-like enzyme